MGDGREGHKKLISMEIDKNMWKIPGNSPPSYKYCKYNYSRYLTGHLGILLIKKEK